MSANTETVPAAGGAARRAAGLPRLLPPVPGTSDDLAAHRSRFGPLPDGLGAHLIDLAEQAGLTGRGGAAFPVYRKLRTAAQARSRKMVIGNAAESEPASRKDAALLWHAPHLVLDGLQLVAEAIGASQAVLYLGHRDQHEHLAQALVDRKQTGTRLVHAPPRFLAGQETALVNRVEGGPALPTFTPPLVPERGIAVHNVETLAHLALIARYGPRWFREQGTTTEPGTMLATLHTGTGRPAVIETGIGTPLHTLVTHQVTQALLIGGYHGTWLPAGALDDVTLDNRALSRHQATLGAGVIALLPPGACGLREAARVTRYLAAESAGQCGPCLNGLPRIAAAMAGLASRKPLRKQREDTGRWLTLVTGRGACHHPDGTARFVRSALTVFAGELRLHAKGQCSATSREPFLPLPSTSSMPATEEDWL
jgi:NADH:ubiquinone oxidoreductase subunit F (NADH-binding)